MFPSLKFVGLNEVRLGRRRLFYFSGCDYFRLARDPRVARAAIASLKEHGLNTAASRRTTGNLAIYTQLETALARFFDAESATLLPDGYFAPIAVAQALRGEVTHAFIDEFTHAALQDAALLLQCPVKPFKHRDPADLARRLAKLNSHHRPIVLTDGLFGLDGAVAPLRDYLKVLAPFCSLGQSPRKTVKALSLASGLENSRNELAPGIHESTTCKRAGAATVSPSPGGEGRGEGELYSNFGIRGEGVQSSNHSPLLLVDDAHGAGILGKTGQGSLEHEGVSRRHIIQCATLSKAFGTYGGVVLSSKAFQKKILAQSRAFAGTTPLPPPLAGAAMEALKILQHEPARLERLAQNTAYLRRQLRAAGWPITDTPGPIVRLPGMTDLQTRKLKSKLLAAGIYPPFINYGPASGPSLFRFVVSSEHTRTQLDQVIEVLKKFK